MKTLLFSILLLALLGCGKKREDQHPWISFTQGQAPTASPSQTPAPPSAARESKKEAEETTTAKEQQPTTKATQPDPNDEKLRSDAKDLHSYVKELKSLHPVPSSIKDAGYTVESYSMSTRLPAAFSWVVITFPPRYLKDTITGKTLKCSKARMFSDADTVRAPNTPIWFKVELYE